MEKEDAKIKFLEHWETLPVEQQIILLEVAAQFQQANAAKAKARDGAVAENPTGKASLK